MLQYPTNVSPENTAKPADTTRMSFTFNGDRLSYYNIRATKLSTGYRYNIWAKCEDDTGSGLPAYNGKKVEMSNNAQYLENGADYVWQVLLAQRDLSGEQPLYDIPVCRGKVLGVDPNDNTTIYIDKNLPLYEWGYDSGEYKPTLDDNDNVLVGMVLTIKGESRLITSYVANAYVDGRYVGIAKIESGFSSVPSADARYQIYSNYLISPQYYFMCRSTPSLSLTLDWSREQSQNISSKLSFRITGIYSQAQSSPIKYYMATLYAFSGTNPDDTSANLYKLKESGKIFSQHIDYTFENCVVGIAPWDGEIDATNVCYRCVVELVTQDNVTYAAYASMAVEGINEYSPEEIEYTWIGINGYGCNYCRDSLSTQNVYVRWFRTNLDTGETIQLYEAEHRYDFKVSTKGNYRYTSIFYKKSTGQPYLLSTKHFDVRDNFDGYFITDLIPMGDNQYETGDTWKFICDIENTTVLQNLDIVSQVGYSRFPSVSSTEQNYLSGTLSGMIGYFSCCQHEYIDDIALVEAWRKFIAQPHPFLLKSQKGDVWVVNIVESPKVEYQEDYYKIPTRFTISWAECADVDEVIIVCNVENMNDTDQAKCSAGAPTEEDYYAPTTEDDYIYIVDSEHNESTIVMYIGDYTEPRIPNTLGGYPVTKIAATAFYSGKNGGIDLQSAWLPDNIKIVE